MEYSDYKDLIEALETKLKTFDKVLIAIEGFMESGKTSIAKALANVPESIRVSIDSYITAGKISESYAKMIDLESLKADLSKLSDKFSRVFLEGLCLREILQAIRVKPDFYIYVKRISQSGLWHDQYHMEDYKNGNYKTKSMWEKSIFEYHLNCKPHEKADFICLRKE